QFSYSPDGVVIKILTQEYQTGKEGEDNFRTMMMIDNEARYECQASFDLSKRRLSTYADSRH
ncbi:MAG: hypothetical protein OEY91_12205, partial [Nitrospirota bacterium]|nr:hypothetical protein [Nitrospirota bacterium]